MKKAVIRIGIEYDHSYLFKDEDVIDAIEGMGSNIVTLINNTGSPLWLNFGAQATVRAVGSNVYVDKVDMPLVDEFDTVSKEDARLPKSQPLPNPSPNTMRLHKVIHDLEEKVAQLEAVNDKLSIENHIKERLIKTHCDDVITAQEAKANELDRYAIPAMQGLCASECEFVTTTELVIEAYDIAEAMIKERNKRTQ